jgi:hypothetical protein
MSQLVQYKNGAHERVSETNPLYVAQQGIVQVRGSIYDTGYLRVPGVDHSDAYTAGDAIGTQFAVTLPFRQGVLYSATLLDLDDEGTQLDLWISDSEWGTKIADDAAFSPADAEMLRVIDILEFTSTVDATNSHFMALRNIGLAVSLPESRLWLQLESPSGTPTIAVGSNPRVRLQFLVDG